jgi:hypothetical protein
MFREQKSPPGSPLLVAILSCPLLNDKSLFWDGSCATAHIGSHKNVPFAGGSEVGTVKSAGVVNDISIRRLDFFSASE